MKRKLAAGITALVLCLTIPFAAMGDVKSRNIQENGKLKETVWEDDNGQPAAGPDGYYSDSSPTSATRRRRTARTISSRSNFSERTENVP